VPYSERTFSQLSGASLSVEKLSDDSIVICDLLSKRIHSLNPTAATVWEACAGAASEQKILAAVHSKLGPAISEDAVQSALENLQEADLIQVQEPEFTAVPGAVIEQSRRRALVSLGVAIGVPAVITLTMADQRAYADNSKSVPITSD